MKFETTNQGSLIVKGDLSYVERDSQLLGLRIYMENTCIVLNSKNEIQITGRPYHFQSPMNEKTSEYHFRKATK